MKYQTLYNIIFSGDRSYRWKRHLLFWLAVFLYHLVRISMIYPPGKIWESRWSLFEITVFWGIIINVLFSYTIVYYLVPKYFQKRKYLHFVAGLLLMFISLLFINHLHQWLLNKPFTNAAAIFTQTFFLYIRGPVIRFFGNPPLICGLLLSLKTLKSWHLEQLKTETLAKENTNAELQLLKAQVHPHFLFNTLNNIYSFTLTQPPLASSLVQKLSDMLNYMIHDCEQRLVPLEKEIKLIQDYMGLEKVRYGNRLNMQVEIKGNYENMLIAPLLMIPFVENCFKHGASIMRGQQWIRLSIQIKQEQLYFHMTNSKPSQAPDANNKKGIGLANVQKRLQLIYPEKHFLGIESTNDIYAVHLQVELEQVPALNQAYKLMPQLQPA